MQELGMGAVVPGLPQAEQCVFSAAALYLQLSGQYLVKITNIYISKLSFIQVGVIMLFSCYCERICRALEVCKIPSRRQVQTRVGRCTLQFMGFLYLRIVLQASRQVYFSLQCYYLGSYSLYSFMEIVLMSSALNFKIV